MKRPPKLPSKPMSERHCGSRFLPGGNSPDAPPDRFSFRVPKGAFAMRRVIAEAIGLIGPKAEQVDGVEAVLDDPQEKGTVYVVATKAARIELQVRSAHVRGVDHDGSMREYVHGKRNSPPQCKDCQQSHWPYQLCEHQPPRQETNT